MSFKLILGELYVQLFGEYFVKNIFFESAFIETVNISYGVEFVLLQPRD